jgi:hypothetical protein
VWDGLNGLDWTMVVVVGGEMLLALSCCCCWCWFKVIGGRDVILFGGGLRRA